MSHDCTYDVTCLPLYYAGEYLGRSPCVHARDRASDQGGAVGGKNTTHPGQRGEKLEVHALYIRCQCIQWLFQSVFKLPFRGRHHRCGEGRGGLFYVIENTPTINLENKKIKT